MLLTTLLFLGNAQPGANTPCECVQTDYVGLHDANGRCVCGPTITDIDLDIFAQSTDVSEVETSISSSEVTCSRDSEAPLHTWNIGAPLATCFAFASGWSVHVSCAADVEGAMNLKVWSNEECDGTPLFSDEDELPMGQTLSGCASPKAFPKLLHKGASSNPSITEDGLSIQAEQDGAGRFCITVDGPWQTYAPDLELSCYMGDIMPPFYKWPWERTEFIAVNECCGQNPLHSFQVNDQPRQCFSVSGSPAFIKCSLDHSSFISKVSTWLEFDPLWVAYNYRWTNGICGSPQVGESCSDELNSCSGVYDFFLTCVCSATMFEGVEEAFADSLCNAGKTSETNSLVPFEECVSTDFEKSETIRCNGEEGVGISVWEGHSNCQGDPDYTTGGTTGECSSHRNQFFSLSWAEDQDYCHYYLAIRMEIENMSLESCQKSLPTFSEYMSLPEVNTHMTCAEMAPGSPSDLEVIYGVIAPSETFVQGLVDLVAQKPEEIMWRYGQSLRHDLGDQSTIHKIEAHSGLDIYTAPESRSPRGRTTLPIPSPGISSPGESFMKKNGAWVLPVVAVLIVVFLLVAWRLCLWTKTKRAVKQIECEVLRRNRGNRATSQEFWNKRTGNSPERGFRSTTSGVGGPSMGSVPTPARLGSVNGERPHMGEMRDPMGSANTNIMVMAMQNRPVDPAARTHDFTTRREDRIPMGLRENREVAREQVITLPSSTPCPITPPDSLNETNRPKPPARDYAPPQPRGKRIPMLPGDPDGPESPVPRQRQAQM